MNIKVWDDKYTIKSDPYCYKVAEICTKTSNDDEELEIEKSGDDTYEKTIGYVNNVPQCFRLIVEHEGRANKCTTLNGYIKHLEAINKKLEENIEKFIKLAGAEYLVEKAISKATKEE